MKIFLLCFLAIFGFGYAPQEEYPAVMKIAPTEIHVQDSTNEQFIVRDVQVLNIGGKPLVIESVNSSCYCATSVVFKNTVHTLESGKLRLNINTKSMKDSVNLITYSISSNASNSPYLVHVYVHRKPEKK